MNKETKKRLQAMSDSERERRLDELNQKLGITQPDKRAESSLEEVRRTGLAEKEVGLQAIMNRIGTKYFCEPYAGV